MFILRIKMFLLLAVLFSILYLLVTLIGVQMGITNFYFYLTVSLFLMFIQYLLGPKIVEWAMHIKYVDKEEAPELHRMVEELAEKAHIPKPKIGISSIYLPNAFAFGHGTRNGRVCVTQGILKLINKNELRAVLGHEISHLKNRDVLTITILSVIPMILYRIAWHFMWFGGGRRRDERGPSTALIGLVAFIFYFVTNLLVLYASRIREYFADLGSIRLGNHPTWLASALYKLVYGSARINREDLREVEGLKAFFLNDPSKASNEIYELRQLDLDMSGTIDINELEVLRAKRIKLSFVDKLMEVLSTHPNMLKRIKQLSEFSAVK
ncbi:MAG: zinc metalloprotease HtpX [Candidatus Omnitrophica bacterium]|nr:zinc metalloprotease HtpX [Candidatus Omnitrophota bacterium]MCM8793137.1 zinc metalloprotease HtpX [Candidatus Omnitrophota bacterium]